ncbi:MAG TPA: hypothetical protein VMM12_04305 [Longimicrobiales bacterium]|nr:hypothetical protein [Longimicrobiales bacterium]
MKRLVLALLALTAAAPVAGQEWLVHRDRFRYIGTRLTIEVIADAPGTLQILRGQDGWLGVAGRVPAGFAAAGLSDDHHLTLSAAGAGPVNYMVTVPRGVWVVVLLPDRSRTEAVGGHTRLRTFEWLEAAAEYADVADATILPGEDVGAGLFTTYAAALAPASVGVPDLRAVRTLTVRTGATRFRIATTRPLSLEPGSPAYFEIRPVGDPMDIVIEIPEGTPAFGLTAAGIPALTVQGAEILPQCGPHTRQWLSEGRQWVTFTPVEGRLECGPLSGPRHKG